MSIEKQSLEAHVELCAERYDNLEDRLEDIVRRIERSYVRFDKMEQSIDKVQEFVTNHHTDRFKALETRQGSLEDKIDSKAKTDPPNVVITITFLRSYMSEKYPIGPCPTTPEIVAINKRIDVSRSVKPAFVAYTDIREKNAACIMPVANELTAPKGEISNNSLMLIVPIFLNFGAGLFIKSIGTRAKDNKIDTKMNGS